MTDAGREGRILPPPSPTGEGGEEPGAERREWLDWGRWQAEFWERGGLVHPTSVAVVATLEEEVRGLLYWLARDLDASVDLDDMVQMLALAQLEAQAATTPALRLSVQRRVRRAAWQVRQSRGREHRVEWQSERLEELAGPDGGLAEMEELTWDEVVQVLGWRDGLLVWLWAVESWTLEELGTLRACTKQQTWRRVRQGLARLRWRVAPEDLPP